MFNDPQPVRPYSRQGQGMPTSPGFFSSQRPIESPREHRTAHRRKAQALHERSQSQNNQQQVPTVRLVKTSPETDKKKEFWEEDDKKENKNIVGDKEQQFEEVQVLPAVSLEEEAAPAVKEASESQAGFPASSVSDARAATNEAQTSVRNVSNTLLPTHAHAESWHRRDGSGATYLSYTSTLREGESSTSIVYNGAERSESRFSQGTTLRGTPTPYEQKELAEVDEAAVVRPLDTLPEDSPERSTVRVVPPSSSQSAESELQSLSEQSQSSPVVLASHSPWSDSPPERPEIPTRRSSLQISSSPSSSPPTHFRFQRISAPPAPRYQSSQESIANSEATILRSSSPNFVAYHSDPSRPRSRSQPLHPTASFDSINSRTQFTRPETGRSLATSSSIASLHRSSSVDTLPPLQVPRKRLRHKPASLSLGSAARAPSGSRMADVDVDTLPYPRQHFSSHLSTIASESDPQSRSTSQHLSHFSLGSGVLTGESASQHLSHFSLGSGVLTGDDASSIPLSGTWPRRRRESAPVESMASDGSAGRAHGSSEEEPEAGDMTLGIFRDESAKPQPLFQPQNRSESAPGLYRTYDGLRPPVPPIPQGREADETFDVVSELHSPRLREKRSGYSLRRRSNSTPSRGHSRGISQASYSETDRGSHGSSLFPTWAKHFYGNGAALLSASKISLGESTVHPRQQIRPQHFRNDSQWTERSITSRLGTGYSEIASTNASPAASSHFLPSIFRPRTRNRSQTDDGNGSRPPPNKLRKSWRSKRSRPSGEATTDSNSRPDSLAIFTDPIPSDNADPDTLPSGQPKYGSLRDSSNSRRPLPRKYSKQKHWDAMSFPRPMTKDRLSDFALDPHLAPTKRASNRLSAWRAPSFVESLDTLVHSKVNRQILLFALGFVCPFLWMIGAVLPIPKKPVSKDDYEKAVVGGPEGSTDDIQAAMMKHEAGDAERRFAEEKAWLKGRWWRWLNRVMSVVGVLVIAAVVALAVVATT